MPSKPCSRSSRLELVQSSALVSPDRSLKTVRLNSLASTTFENMGCCNAAAEMWQSSEAVDTLSSCDSPWGEQNWEFLRPRSRATLFICQKKFFIYLGGGGVLPFYQPYKRSYFLLHLYLCSTFPQNSAMARAASFPLGSISPYSSCSTVSRSPGLRPATVPSMPPASSLTRTLVSMPTLCFSKMSRAVKQVMILVREAISRGSFAFFLKRVRLLPMSRMQYASAVISPGQALAYSSCQDWLQNRQLFGQQSSSLVPRMTGSLMIFWLRSTRSVTCCRVGSTGMLNVSLRLMLWGRWSVLSIRAGFRAGLEESVTAGPSFQKSISDLLVKRGLVSVVLMRETRGLAWPWIIPVRNSRLGRFLAGMVGLLSSGVLYSMGLILSSASDCSQKSTFEVASSPALEAERRWVVTGLARWRSWVRLQMLRLASCMFFRQRLASPKNMARPGGYLLGTIKSQLQLLLPLYQVLFRSLASLRFMIPRIICTSFSRLCSIRFRLLAFFFVRLALEVRLTLLLGGGWVGSGIDIRSSCPCDYPCSNFSYLVASSSTVSLRM